LGSWVTSGSPVPRGELVGVDPTNPKYLNDFDVAGAQERTRTFTAVKPLAPEASASTNSATWARAGYYGCLARLSNWRNAAV
jgi:hypothetical protein